MPELDYDIEVEKGIGFLVRSLEKSKSSSLIEGLSKHAPKPVALHSIKVGLHLYSRGYPKEVVLGGILHDILEWTTISEEVLTKEFGPEVVRLVKANTGDRQVMDGRQRYIELFDRCRRAGRGALVIQAVDVLDNINYYSGDTVQSIVGHDTMVYGLTKSKYLIESLSGEIGDEPICRELRERFESLLQTSLSKYRRCLR